MLPYVLGLAGLILAFVGLGVWMQQGGARGGPPQNQFGEITQPCDGVARLYRYDTNPHTIIFVRVERICTEIKFEYQTENGSFIEPEDWTASGQVARIIPRVGEVYAFSIPKMRAGRHLRVTCTPPIPPAKPESPHDTSECAFTVINASRQPTSPVPLIPVTTTTLACGTDILVPLHNFALVGVGVCVTWTGLCKSPNSVGVSVPQTPTVRLRTMGVSPPAYSPAGPVTQTPGANEATWNGQMGSNQSLELKCPGSISGCAYRVDFR